MRDKLRVGIAGYGIVGKRRRQFIDKHPDFVTTAVCDQTFTKSGPLSDGIKGFRSYRELLDEQLDVLFVCLTNDVAAEVVISGLERGLHVFCEKPPGRNIKDIIDVIRTERKHPDLRLKYGFNHRYHESIKCAAELISSGELGQVINIKGTYGKSKIVSFDSDWRTKRAVAGGGILLDQGIHMLDMMRLLGGEFTQIHSFVANDFWNHDVEDNAYALMRTESGVVGILHSSATQWRHRFQLEVTLTRGAIVLSGILSGTKSYGAETITVVFASEEDGGDPLEKTTRYNKDNSWRDEIDEFAKHIVNKTPVVAGSSYQALKTMELVYKIYCADTKWRERYELSSEVPADLLIDPFAKEI